MRRQSTVHVISSFNMSQEEVPLYKSLSFVKQYILWGSEVNPQSSKFMWLELKGQYLGTGASKILHV